MNLKMGDIFKCSEFDKVQYHCEYRQHQPYVDKKRLDISRCGQVTMTEDYQVGTTFDGKPILKRREVIMDLKVEDVDEMPYEPFVVTELIGDGIYALRLSNGQKINFTFHGGYTHHIHHENIEILGQEGIEDWNLRWRSDRKAAESARFLGTTLKDLNKEDLLTIIGFMAKQVGRTGIEFIDDIRATNAKNG